MARTTVANLAPDGMEGIAKSSRWQRTVPAAACVSALLMLGTIPASGAAPAEGDTYVYVEVNAYTNEVNGRLRERVGKVDPDRVTISVEPDGTVAAGSAHTKVLTKDGNWLQNLVVSHGKWLEYHFAAPYPAYVFPLAPGKTWSLRVDAKVPGYTRTRSVRVDGAVVGLERIRVPAGEYDTVKIRRLVHAGDAEGALSETAIIEYEWYAPALGRTVRATTESKHHDYTQTSNTQLRLGDRLRYELVEVRPAGR